MRGGTLSGKPLTSEEAGLVLPRPGWLRAMTAEALKEAEEARAAALRAIADKRAASKTSGKVDAMQPMKVTIKMPAKMPQNVATPGKVVVQAPNATVAAAAAAQAAVAGAKARQQTAAPQQQKQKQAQSQQAQQQLLLQQQQELQRLQYLRQQAIQQQQAEAFLVQQQEYWPYSQSEEWGCGMEQGVDGWAIAADQWSAFAQPNTQQWSGGAAMWQQQLHGAQQRAGKGAGKGGKGRGKGKGKSKAVGPAT